MTFWERHAAAELELARNALPPETCERCLEHKRGVLLGVCDECFVAHERKQGRA